jgi:hypothetical protein
VLLFVPLVLLLPWRYQAHCPSLLAQMRCPDFPPALSLTRKGQRLPSSPATLIIPRDSCLSRYQVEKAKVFSSRESSARAIEKVALEVLEIWMLYLIEQGDLWSESHGAFMETARKHCGPNEARAPPQQSRRCAITRKLGKSGDSTFAATTTH